MSRLVVCLIVVVCASAMLATDIDEPVDSEGPSMLHRSARAVAKDTKSATRAITGTTAKCGKSTFLEYNTDKKCCMLSPNALFEDTTLTGCAFKSKESVSKLNSYVKDYVLNIHHENGKINYANRATLEALGPAACYVNCLFAEKGFIKDGKTVDDTLLGPYFKSMAPSAWATIVDTAVTDCKTQVDAYTPTQIANFNTKSFCSIYPLMYMQCVRFMLIGSCPVELEPTKFKPKVKEFCVEGNEMKKSCTLEFTTAAPVEGKR